MAQKRTQKSADMASADALMAGSFVGVRGCWPLPTSQPLVFVFSCPIIADDPAISICFFVSDNCRRGTISSVGTHGLCVLPRPQGALSRRWREWCCRRGTISSVGTHGLCVLPRPQGASSRHRRELASGLCARATGLLPLRGGWTHRPCVLPRPQGASSRHRRELASGLCARATGLLPLRHTASNSTAYRHDSPDTSTFFPP